MQGEQGTRESCQQDRAEPERPGSGMHFHRSCDRYCTATMENIIDDLENSEIAER